MKKTTMLSLLGFALVLTSASSAFAETPQAKGSTAATAATVAIAKSDDYGYTFLDDDLTAGGFGPNDSRIQVGHRMARTGLIRPRTSFVQEMLKSVENL